jgi:CBS domain containing-hemolysin-like protein
MSKPFNINLFVKDVLFVPPAMRILDLLLQMRETGIKMAVVVDEYGGADGIVSLSDVVEKVIGNIQDLQVNKSQKNKIVKEEQMGSIIVDAQATLSEVSKEGGIKIISEDRTVDSVGGLIFSIAGKIPVKGELIFFPEQNLEFEILEADPRCIKRVRIRKR